MKSYKKVFRLRHFFLSLSTSCKNHLSKQHASTAIRSNFYFLLYEDKTTGTREISHFFFIYSLDFKSVIAIIIHRYPAAHQTGYMENRHTMFFVYHNYEFPLHSLLYMDTVIYVYIYIYIYGNGKALTSKHYSH